MLSGKKVYFYIVFITLFINNYVYAENINDYRYVINISSSLTKQKIKIAFKYANQYKAYEIRVKVKGKQWYRLRLGYFKTRRSANRLIQKLSKDYPDAWLDTIKKGDKRHLKIWLKNKTKSCANSCKYISTIKKRWSS